MSLSFTDDDLHYPNHFKKFLHSLFSNIEVYLNNQEARNSNSLYGHKAPIVSKDTRRIVVNEVYQQTMKNQSTYQPACHNFRETIATRFFIPSGQKHFIQKIFNNS